MQSFQGRTRPRPEKKEFQGCCSERDKGEKEMSYLKSAKLVSIPG
jgi:hypothetical protein